MISRSLRSGDDVLRRVSNGQPEVAQWTRTRYLSPVRASGVRSKFALYALAACGAFAIGGLSVFEPRVLVLALFALSLFALAKPLGGLIWLTVGGMLVLQGSEGLSVPKLVYFAGVLVAAVAGWNRTLHLLRGDSRTAAMRRSLAGASLLAGLVALGAIFSLMTGSGGVADVVRDAFTYLLIAAAVPIGISAGATSSVRALRLLTAILGLVAAVSFGVAWLSRRGVSSIPLEQIAFASIVVVAYGFCVSLVSAGANGRLRIGWLSAATATLGGVLVTGTRSGLVLLAAFPLVAGRERKGRVPPVRLAIMFTIVAVSGSILLSWFSSRFSLPAGFLDSRFQAAINAYKNGYAADQSGYIRAQAYAIAYQSWKENIIFGRGLGVLYPSPDPLTPGGTYQLDTPLIILSKFGLVGACILVVALVLIFWPVFQKGPAGWTQSHTEGRAFAALVILLLPFGLPIEDKGLALSIALIAAALTASSLASRETIDGVGPDGYPKPQRKDGARSRTRGSASSAAGG